MDSWTLALLRPIFAPRYLKRQWMTDVIAPAHHCEAGADAMHGDDRLPRIFIYTEAAFQV